MEKRGVTIFERTVALEIRNGRVLTNGGVLKADIVVRATEGYTPRLRGQSRTLLPMHSWIFATAPLSEDQWGEIGLDDRQAFGDGRRMVTYGQRTADNRLVFGARGTYHFRSRIRERLEPDHPHYEWMTKLIHSIFPILRGVDITHYWGGAFAVPRHWSPSVCYQKKRGQAWLGGYVGMGVAASNLAGRTLAELIAEDDTERTRLPWVNVPPPRWEPEPLRWAGVASVATLGHHADTIEENGGSSKVASQVFDLLAGH